MDEGLKQNEIFFKKSEKGYYHQEHIILNGLMKAGKSDLHLGFDSIHRDT